MRADRIAFCRYLWREWTPGKVLDEEAFAEASTAWKTTTGRRSQFMRTCIDGVKLNAIQLMLLSKRAWRSRPRFACPRP